MNSSASSNFSEKPGKADNKRQAILDAAYKTFSAYGFRRTSMGDIAEAAGISRPALYIQFKNKPDIFRALVRKVLETSIANTREALAGNTPLQDRLMAALDAGFIQFHREIGNSAHGEELFSAKTELAGDLAETWLIDLQSLFAEALASEDIAAAKDNAAILIDAMMGMKQRAPSIVEMEHKAGTLTALVAGAASP